MARAESSSRARAFAMAPKKKTKAKAAADAPEPAAPHKKRSRRAAKRKDEDNKPEEVEAELGKKDDDHDPEAARLEKEKKSGLMNLMEALFTPIFIKAFTMTFVAEWGDRSQIATIALAASTSSGELHPTACRVTACSAEGCGGVSPGRPRHPAAPRHPGSPGFLRVSCTFV